MIKKFKTIINSNIGFTLVELMVVISMIGVLATIGSVSFAGSVSKARDAKKMNDLNIIALGLRVFATSADKFPTASELLPDDIRWANFLSTIGGISLMPPNSISYYCYFVDKTDWTNAVII
ncbi:MAG: prepilin-type N-terminal cleavage/methylation domain-containing protein, partial [Patescibacteria group bacterium]